MNGNESWRSIIGQPKEDKRLRDVELVLRCLALSENGGNYEKPMKGFLNKYAESMRTHGDDFETMIENFVETADLVLAKLGEKPFHLRGRLNYGALDSVMATLLKYEAPKKLKDWFDSLLANDDYQEAISFNTSDEAVVAKRLEIAEDALDEF
jgi:hypothetical protein